MRRIVYRLTAEADLEEINNYGIEFSEQTRDRFFEDIHSSIEILKQFPETGRLLDNGRRRFISAKYRFAISHRVYDDRIEIVGVYRFQNRTS